MRGANIQGAVRVTFPQLRAFHVSNIYLQMLTSSLSKFLLANFFRVMLHHVKKHNLVQVVYLCSNKYKKNQDCRCAVS